MASTFFLILAICFIIYAYRFLAYGIYLFIWLLYFSFLAIKTKKPSHSSFVSTGNSLKDGSILISFLQNRINYLGKNETFNSYRIFMIYFHEGWWGNMSTHFTNGNSTSIYQFIRVAHAQGYRVKLTRINSEKDSKGEN